MLLQLVVAIHYLPKTEAIECLRQPVEVTLRWRDIERSYIAVNEMVRLLDIHVQCINTYPPFMYVCMYVRMYICMYVCDIWNHII